MRHPVYDFCFCMMLDQCVYLLYEIKPVDFCTILELCVFFWFDVGPVCLFVTMLDPSLQFYMILSPRVYFLCDCIKRVKCTLVQALRLCTGRTVHRGSRGIALLFHDHGTRTR